jgi:hypothetical protein
MPIGEPSRSRNSPNALITDLQSDGAEHSPDAANERLAHALAHARSFGTVVLDGRDLIVDLFVLAIKFSGHGDVSGANGSSLGVVGGKQTITAPSVERRRELPAKIDRVSDSCGSRTAETLSRPEDLKGLGSRQPGPSAGRTRDLYRRLVHQSMRLIRGGVL